MLLAAAIVQVVFQIMLKHRLRATPGALDTQIIASIKGPAVLFIIILGPLLGFIALTELETPTWDSLDGLDIWARRVWARRSCARRLPNSSSTTNGPWYGST